MNTSCFVSPSSACKSKHLFVDMIVLLIDVKIEFASKLKYFPLVNNDHVNSHVLQTVERVGSHIPEWISCL